jgi:hypothetical protein
MGGFLLNSITRLIIKQTYCQFERGKISIYISIFMHDERVETSRFPVIRTPQMGVCPVISGPLAKYARLGNRVGAVLGSVVNQWH